MLFDGGLIGVPANDCKPDSVPDDCQNSCYGGTSSLDADGDGIANCQEIWDETEPCDNGSKIERLNPVVCGSPNGFFGQVNIATVINKSFAPLPVSLKYFDATGAVKGSAGQTLQPNQKWDVIVNELGLLPDTYGTLCVTVAGTVPGLWTGGLTIYKLRDTQSPFAETSDFDYALHYPFHNPERQRSIIPVNTYFPLDPDARGLVANWIRLIDATPADGQPLVGTLKYFDDSGTELFSQRISIVDGGRVDYGAHEHFARNTVGLAEFIPDSPDRTYYIEATRYFYEGVGASSSVFYTAFPLPIQRLSGAARGIPVNTVSQEFSVLELLNGTSSALVGGNAAALRLVSAAGINVAGSAPITVPAKGTVHRIVSTVEPTEVRWARVQGPTETLVETALTYGFDFQNVLRYAFATPLIESAGPRQLTEFNTFLGHQNTLKLVNLSAQTLKIQLSINDYAHSPLPLPPELADLNLGPNGFKEVQLNDLPRDSYGSIAARVDGGKVGLLMVNYVSKPGAYVMPFIAR